TKLMDVPKLTPELIAKIADQSDAQSGARSVRALERIRDANLVTILRGLKAQRWGAGQVIAAFEAGLRDHAIDITQPVPTARRAVPLDWADYNGHMNEARYLEAFAEATDRFMEIVGCDADYIATGGSYFTAETHIRHLGEVHIGQAIEIDTLCLEGAGKKMRLFHEMRVDGALVATGEHMLIHVSLETRAAAEPGPVVADKLGRIAAAHAHLPRPGGIGRAVGQGR
ncbi:MAG: thioesterase family protein, partial [Alphaproteobacteria bacterium]|nr:thioesterase family protein [Alphaproteobacteria bacterium]